MPTLKHPINFLNKTLLMPHHISLNFITKVSLHVETGLQSRAQRFSEAAIVCDSEITAKSRRPRNSSCPAALCSEMQQMGVDGWQSTGKPTAEPFHLSTHNQWIPGLASGDATTSWLVVENSDVLSVLKLASGNLTSWVACDAISWVGPVYGTSTFPPTVWSCRESLVQTGLRRQSDNKWKWKSNRSKKREERVEPISSLGVLCYS